MNYSKALGLLKKYVKEKHIIKHCKQVAYVAEQVAKLIKKNGHNINAEEVKCAALLHDIGRGIKHENHEQHSETILKKEGYPEIANIVKTHGVRFERAGNESLLPKTIEQRIVAYADGRDNDGQIVTLKERYELLKVRRTSNKMKLIMKSWPRAKQNEQYLLKLAGKEEFEL